MSSCGFCGAPASTRKPAIFCAGLCKKQYHISCVGLPADINNTLLEFPGLRWTCKGCTSKCTLFSQEKLDEFLCSITSSFESMKTDFLKLAFEKFTELNSTSQNATSYSTALKNNTKPAVIVKPKNSSQQILQTKSDIFKSIDPLQENIQINKVKHIKNGGLVVGCNSREENEKFKKLVEAKLSQDYEVKEVKGLCPRIRISGISGNMPEDVLLEYILKMNKNIFNSDSAVKILKFGPTKRNDQIFQAVLEVDKSSYSRVIKSGYLLVGYDSCAVYDAIEIRRCFKCNEFHHHVSKCTKDNYVCPRCSKNHIVKECKETLLVCSNCVKLKHTTDIDVNHAAWDSNCPAFIQACEKLRSDILSLQ